MTKAERLAEFFRRLATSEPGATEQGALDLLSAVLIQVENELTSIPFDPSYPLNDGRMYPPMADARRPVRDRADLARYRSRNHNTFISSTGAIRVEDLSGTCLFEKPGKDEAKIEKC